MTKTINCVKKKDLKVGALLYEKYRTLNSLKLISVWYIIVDIDVKKNMVEFYSTEINTTRKIQIDAFLSSGNYDHSISEPLQLIHAPP